MAYLTKKQKQDIIYYSNLVIESLAESFRNQDSDDFLKYQRHYYDMKSLFQIYIESL